MTKGLRSILLAPDSFKGSLSAPEFCRIATTAINAIDPGIRVTSLPLADGGEGSLEVLLESRPGMLRHGARVTGPAGRPVAAWYGGLPDERMAVIETALASGLPLLRPEERRPLTTTSAGSGELIAAALERGYRRLLIFLGGSATCDGGAGLLTALGVRFLDSRGRPLPPGGGALQQLERIDTTGVLPALKGAELIVACDVENPLTGPRGAVPVFAPQKGAGAADLPVLTAGMERLAGQAAAFSRKVDLHLTPGSGAAGGMAFGLLALAGARLTSGFDEIAAITGLDRLLDEQRPDLIISGEGCINGQSADGKLLSGLGRRAAARDIPLLAFTGRQDPGAERLLTMGITAMHTIAPDGMSEADSIASAGALLSARLTRVLCRYGETDQPPLPDGKGG